jgi:putative DNA primase/helicase
LYYRGDTSVASAYTTKGTLAEWRDTVARLSHGNTRPMLSLAVAFAAPLLHLVELESGGFPCMARQARAKLPQPRSELRFGEPLASKF